MSGEAARRMERAKTRFSFCRSLAFFFRSVFSALAKQTTQASETSEIYGLNNSLYYLGLPEGRSW